MSPSVMFLAGACSVLVTAVPLAFWLSMRTADQDDFPKDYDPYASPIGDGARPRGA